MGSTSSNSPNSLELSLGLKPSYVPKTIANLFSDLAKVDDVQKKLSVLDDYLKKYEEELARVEPFRRDLPQCMLLLMDAIDIMKGEISKLITNHGEEESEFDDQIRRVDEFSKCKRRIYENDGINISPPWSSIQENGTEIHKEMAILASESQKTPMIDSDRFGLSLKVNQAPEIKQQEQFSDPTWKTRTRRHWTHELHARFQWALDVLGGPEAATPKQIKEVMRVSGLTNDQIKSHLQKYRLNARADGRSKNQINGADHYPAEAKSYDQSYNNTGIWAPRAQVPPLNGPNLAQISTESNDQQNDVVNTNDNNSANSNVAGWLNHFGFPGPQF